MADRSDNCMLILLTVLVVLLLFKWSGNGGYTQQQVPYEAMDNIEGELAAGSELGPVDGEAATVGDAVLPVTRPAVQPVPVSGPSCPGSSETVPFIDPQTGMLIDGPGFDGGLGSQMKVQSGPIPSNYYFLDDGANGEMSIDNNIVSPSCCGETWPTPFQKRADPYVCGNKDKFVQSRMFGNNTYQDSGCMCTSKKQAQFLYNRGNNAGGWF